MNPTPFRPRCRPVLIGSLPVRSHRDADRMVWQHTPEIPVWAQLPTDPAESMTAQFLPGMPGLRSEGGKIFVDPDGPGFSEELTRFYEEYLAVTEGQADLLASRFALQPDTAAGFFQLLASLERPQQRPAAVKGQVTGPLTFTLGVTDRAGKAIFYDLQARDAAVKLLALKARWQVRRLAARVRPVIVFLDEPALAGFGSSELISITREQIAESLGEVVAAVHAEGALAGVHVCANTDWNLLLDSELDIVNFDAYHYFDRFILYADDIRRFLDRGGILAWGIVPTGPPEAIEQETAASLHERWQRQLEQVLALGADRGSLVGQSLITPSCGAGSLAPELADRVLRLTRELSARIRAAEGQG